MKPLPVRSPSSCARPGEFIALLFACIKMLGLGCVRPDESRPPGAPAIPLAWFKELGIGKRVLQWLLYHEHLEHLRAVGELAAGQAMPGTGIRTSRGLALGEWEGPIIATVVEPVASFHPRKDSCFAATERGREFAGALLLKLFTASPGDSSVWELLVLGRLAPTYDRERREFLLGTRVLKHFLQPSANQELVLRAAEELEWPDSFDDPLPPARGRCAKVRLHDTIKALNRHQTPYLVHFKGDGTGTRVGWELR